MRLLAMTLVLLVPGVASAAERSGFTSELGTGVAYGVLVPDAGGDYSSTAHVGFAPFALGVGGFVTDKIALTVRTSNVATKAIRYETSTFAGVSAQYWVSDSFFAALGVGIGAFGKGALSGLFDPTYVAHTFHGVSLGVQWQFGG